MGQPFDVVITVCDEARDACPVFPGAAEQRHWSFPDPSAASGTEADQRAAYRAVRDGPRARIEGELIPRRAGSGPP